MHRSRSVEIRIHDARYAALSTSRGTRPTSSALVNTLTPGTWGYDLPISLGIARVWPNRRMHHLAESLSLCEHCWMRLVALNSLSTSLPLVCPNFSWAF